MTAAKIALSMPAALVRAARKKVASGRAKSLSAFVASAVEEKLARDELADILDAIEAEHGKIPKAASAWAKKVLA